MNTIEIPEVSFTEAVEIPETENATPASNELSSEEQAKRDNWVFMVHKDGSKSRKKWVLADFRKMQGVVMQRSHISPNDKEKSHFDKMVFPKSPFFTEEERKNGARVEANFSKRCLEEYGEVAKHGEVEYQTVTDATLKANKDHFVVWPVVTERGLLQYSIGLPGEDLSEVEEW